MQQPGLLKGIQINTPTKTKEEIERQRKNLEETITTAMKHAYTIEEELMSRPQDYGEVVRLHGKAKTAGDAIQYLLSIRYNRFLLPEEQAAAIAREKAKLNVIKEEDAQKMELQRTENGFWVNAKGEPVGIVEEETKHEEKEEAPVKRLRTRQELEDGI